MPKIRSPRARQAGDDAPAPAGAPARKSSDVVLWYHANKQWLPLVGTVFGGAVVYLLSQVQTLRPTMGMLGGLALIVGAVIWGLTKPEDAPVRVGQNRAIPLVLVAAALILGVALVPYLHVNYPGHEHFHGTLSPRHPTAAFQLDSGGGLVEVVVHGAVRRGSGTASGGYSLKLEHDGNKRRLEGVFKRTYSSRKIRRGRVRIGTSSEYTYNVNQLESLGRGRYRLSLDGVDPSLENWVRVKVFTTWYSDRQLYWALAILVALGLVADVVSTRFKQRTRLASAAIVAVGFSIYYATRFTPDAAMSTMLGGALLSILAGWVGGTVLAFIAKRAGNEPRAAKAAARDDEED